MQNIFLESINKIQNKFSSILPKKKEEIFLTISTTKAAPLFFNEEEIIKNLNEIVKERNLDPLSIRHKNSNWKLIVAINGKKQYIYNDQTEDSANSYLTSQHYSHFDGLYDKNTQDIICLLEYSIPKDTKKSDILNSDLIRISPAIKWLWINIQQLFHNAAASYGFKYVIWYHISSRLSKYFCTHWNRVRLVSLPTELQSHLCDSPETRSKCTVVLLDKINTQ